MLKKIESKTSKTANFLSEMKFINFDNNTLLIEVNNLSKFIFDSLDKDIEMIAEIVSKYLKNEIKIKLIQGVEKTIKNHKSKKEKEHPLIMEVLNEYEGQIIK